MATTSRIIDQAQDAGVAADKDTSGQLADLRAQLDRLISDRAAPMLQDARDTALDQVDALSQQVRTNPLAAVAITAAVAFLLGRMFR